MIRVRDSQGRTHRLVSTDLRETYLASSVTGTIYVDVSAAQIQRLTMTGNITPSFVNVPKDVSVDLTLILTQDGTGSRTVTWPAAVKWPSATAPTLSTPASSVDIVVMQTVDGGTTWYANLAGKAYA